MPDTDRYEFVAVRDIYHGSACAYRAGDLVPAANVEEHGYLDDGSVVHRDEYKSRDTTDAQQVDTERLQRSAVPTVEPDGAKDTGEAEKPAAAPRKSGKTTTADKS
jgi:hypothetical protein